MNEGPEQEKIVKLRVRYVAPYITPVLPPCVEVTRDGDWVCVQYSTRDIGSMEVMDLLEQTAPLAEIE